MWRWLLLGLVLTSLVLSEARRKRRPNGLVYHERRDRGMAGRRGGNQAGVTADGEYIRLENGAVVGRMRYHRGRFGRRRRNRRNR